VAAKSDFKESASWVTQRAVFFQASTARRLAGGYGCVSWVHIALFLFCVPKALGGFWPPTIDGSCYPVRAGVEHHDNSLLSCTASQPHA